MSQLVDSVPVQQYCLSMLTFTNILHYERINININFLSLYGEATTSHLATKLCQLNNVQGDNCGNISVH